MRLTSLKTVAGLLLSATLLTTACKSKEAKDNASNNDTVSTSMEPKDNAQAKPDTAMVTFPSDDSLSAMAKDAVKDFPGVTATVNNGELTLSGNIKRDRFPKLMTSVSSLRAKKINNNLTINK